MSDKPYTDARYRIVRPSRLQQARRERRLIWLAMAGFISMLALGSAHTHDKPAPPATTQQP